MGAEGDTNLDNDGAADYLASFSEQLFSRIITLLKHPQGHEYDDAYICDLFALVEIVFALDARGLIYTCPDPDDLVPLLQPYRDRWEAYHTDANGSVPEARGSTMQVTFEELERIVRTFGEGMMTFVEVEPDPNDPNEELIRKIFGE